MVAIRLDGVTLAREVCAALQSTIAACAAVPCLAIVQVGDHPASVIYIRRKIQALDNLGLNHRLVQLPASTDAARLAAVILALNDDPMCHGIIVQLPLPNHVITAAILALIDPRKDVDGLTPLNQGLVALGQLEAPMIPATPLGCYRLLSTTGRLVPGAVATVVGRSALVGRPMAQLLLNHGCTVLQTHSHTRDLAQFTRQADILVVAAGQRGLITPDHVRPGAVVVDVGIHRDAEGKLAGDVDPDVAAVAGWLTPVPGGVGPMTIAMLIHNLVKAASPRPPLMP